MQYVLFTQAAMMGACKSLQAQLAISAATHAQRSIACLLRKKSKAASLPTAEFTRAGRCRVIREWVL